MACVTTQFPGAGRDVWPMTVSSFAGVRPVIGTGKPTPPKSRATTWSGKKMAC
jgi:hypothetical protein